MNHHYQRGLTALLIDNLLRIGRLLRNAKCRSCEVGVRTVS